MDKSQRRELGKEALKSGHRLKIVFALTLVASAAGFLLLNQSGPNPATPAETLASTDCISNMGPDATSVAPCSPLLLSTEAPEATAPIATPSATNDLDSERPARRTNGARAWGDAQPGVYAARPGYTMAELCAAGLENNGLHCQSDLNDGRYLTAYPDSMPAADSRKTISGQVLTTEGDAVVGVRIVATPERLRDGQSVASSNTLRYWTVTDSGGAYSLKNLPNGEYTIRSSAHDFYLSARISARTGTNYADLLVSRASVISVEGQVMSATGEPLEGVTVLPNALGQPSVLTQDDGHFMLSVTLKPTVDSLALRFQRPGFHEQNTKIQLHAPGLTKSSTVHVEMHPVEIWTAMNGTVYSDAGQRLAGRLVEIKSNSASRAYRATTDRRGQFTFPVIEAPDDYRMVVFGGPEHKDSQQTIHVDADSPELDVTLESYEFGTVTGQLVNSNGEPVPDFNLMMRNTGSTKANTVVTSDAYGNFEVPMVPAGDLIVASQSAPSILVQGLHLEPGEKIHLPLVLDWGEHEIHGSVVDTRGNPVPASQIVLQWSYQSDGVTTRATRRTAADTQGHFAFSNLGPGPHSLQVAAPGFPTVDIDHDLRQQGYDVTVRLN